MKTEPIFARVRAKSCAACPAPCPWQHDAAAHATPANACPSGHWPRWGRGDALAERIERRILQPIERRIPAAALLVAVARRCGGCKSDVARLNGDSTGSSI